MKMQHEKNKIIKTEGMGYSVTKKPMTSKCYFNQKFIWRGQDTKDTLIK